MTLCMYDTSYPQNLNSAAKCNLITSPLPTHTHNDNTIINFSTFPKELVSKGDDIDKLSSSSTGTLLLTLGVMSTLLVEGGGAAPFFGGMLITLKRLCFCSHNDTYVLNSKEPESVLHKFKHCVHVHALQYLSFGVISLLPKSTF